MNLGYTACGPRAPPKSMFYYSPSLPFTPPTNPHDNSIPNPHPIVPFPFSSPVSPKINGQTDRRTLVVYYSNDDVVKFAFRLLLCFYSDARLPHLNAVCLHTRACSFIGWARIKDVNPWPNG